MNKLLDIFTSILLLPLVIVMAILAFVFDPKDTWQGIMEEIGH